jgi:DNA helicase HerA-like ATPase
MVKRLFNFDDIEALGRVLSVDTASVVVRVSDIDRLRKLQVNRLVVLQSSRPGQHLVGIVQKITRSASEQVVAAAQELDGEDEALAPETNLVKVTLIGTLLDKIGSKVNVFRRTLETVPEIDSNCFAVEGESLTGFMRVISNVSGDGQKLSLGKYTLDEEADAYLNGNRFFQRHAIIVGSTGSGKSWTTARILEQVASLPDANAIVFDIHGEYEPLKDTGFKHFKIAGPSDLGSRKGLNDGILYIPYWLLGYEALTSMFVDASDSNAHNQVMVVARTITEAKRNYLEAGNHIDVLSNFTIDSPVPFDLAWVLGELNRLNVEMVPGARSGSEKQGDFHGKLSRLIARLENKVSDRRLGFLFNNARETQEFEWLGRFCATLVSGSARQPSGGGGVKIIDFSEVPSDVLPLIVSLIARIVFSVQQWTLSSNRHPIALFCDEAHIYLPERGHDSTYEVALDIFEKIAKEGRKYGVGLVVISQRPAEVNRTVLSQCNNLVAMRLTNAEDQSVVRRLLPDSLGGFSDVLPVLDTGEALVVGDASLLPSRIRVAEPTAKPNSGTMDFWDRWTKNETPDTLADAVKNWRRQSITNL